MRYCIDPNNTTGSLMECDYDWNSCPKCSDKGALDVQHAGAEAEACDECSGTRWPEEQHDSHCSLSDPHDFSLAVGADDVHAVYAVLDTNIGTHKVRVSDFLDWDEAIDLHERLHNLTREDWRGLRTNNARPITYPGYTVYGRPVRFFAVRSAADPDWPSGRPVLTLRDDKKGARWLVRQEQNDSLLGFLTEYILTHYLAS